MNLTMLEYGLRRNLSFELDEVRKFLRYLCLKDTQWKAVGAEGREQKQLNCSTRDAPPPHYTDK